MLNEIQMTPALLFGIAGWKVIAIVFWEFELASASKIEIDVHFLIVFGNAVSMIGKESGGALSV